MANDVQTVLDIFDAHGAGNGYAQARPLQAAFERDPVRLGNAVWNAMRTRDDYVPPLTWDVRKALFVTATDQSAEDIVVLAERVSTVRDGGYGRPVAGWDPDLDELISKVTSMGDALVSAWQERARPPVRGGMGLSLLRHGLLDANAATPSEALDDTLAWAAQGFARAVEHHEFKKLVGDADAHWSDEVFGAALLEAALQPGVRISSLPRVRARVSDIATDEQLADLAARTTHNADVLTAVEMLQGVAPRVAIAALEPLAERVLDDDTAHTLTDAERLVAMLAVARLDAAGHDHDLDLDALTDRALRARPDEALTEAFREAFATMSEPRREAWMFDLYSEDQIFWALVDLCLTPKVIDEVRRRISVWSKKQGGWYRDAAIEGLQRCGPAHVSTWLDALVGKAACRDIYIDAIIGLAGPEHAPRLVEALDDRTVRASAVNALQRLSTDALDALIEGLGARKKAIREGAVEVLESLPPDRRIREAAAARLDKERAAPVKEALERLASAEETPPGLQALHTARAEANEDELAEAIEALTADRRVWKHWFEQRIADRQAGIEPGALDAEQRVQLLAIVEWVKANPDDHTRRSQAEDAMRPTAGDPIAPWAFAELFSAFDKDDYKSEGFARDYARAFTRAALPAVVHQLETSEIKAQKALLERLAVTGSSDARRIFLKGLASKSKRTRDACTEHLTALGASVLPEVWPLLEARTAGHRQAAAAVCGQIGAAASIEALRAALDKEKSKAVKKSLQLALESCRPRSLAELGPQPTGQALNDFMAGSDVVDLPAFIDIPTLSGTVHTDDGVALSDDALRWLLFKLSTQTGDEAPDDALVGVCARLDPDQRAALLDALMAMGASQTTATDERWLVLAHAVLASDAQLAALAEPLDKMARGGQSVRAFLAVTALGRHGAPAAIAHLDRHSRKARSKGLRRHSKAALDALADRLGLTVEDVRDRGIEPRGVDIQALAAWRTRRTTRLDDPTRRARDQVVERLTTGLLAERRWSPPGWVALFVRHPIFSALSPGLAFVVEQPTGSEARDGEPNDSIAILDDSHELRRLDGSTWSLTDAPDARLHLLHPAEVPRTTVDATRSQLDALGLIPTFAQLDRTCHRPPDDLRGFMGASELTPEALTSSLRKLGYGLDAVEDAGFVFAASRELGSGVQLSIGHTGHAITRDAWQGAAVRVTSASASRNGERLDLRQHPAMFSELVSDLYAVGCEEPDAGEIPEHAVVFGGAVRQDRAVHAERSWPSGRLELPAHTLCPHDETPLPEGATTRIGTQRMRVPRGLALASAGDGRWLAAIFERSRLVVWSMPERTVAHTAAPDQFAHQRLQALAFAPDSAALRVVANDALYELALDGTWQSRRHPMDEASWLGLSPNGRWLGELRNDRELTVRDAATLEVVARQTTPLVKPWVALPGSDAVPTRVAIAARFGARAFSVGALELDSGQTAVLSRAHDDAVNRLAISPDGTTVVGVTSDGGRLLRWSTDAALPDDAADDEKRTSTARVLLDGLHLTYGSPFRISRDGRHVLLGSDDQPLAVRLDTQTPQVASPGPGPGAVRAVARVPGTDDDALSVLYESGIVRTEPLDEDSAPESVALPHGRVDHIELSRDGARVLMVTSQRRVLVYDLAQARFTAGIALGQVTRAPRSVALTPDGAVGVVLRDEAVLRDLATGSLRGRHDDLSSGAFSRDGTLVALARGPRIEVRRTADDTVVQVLHGHEEAVGSVAFSADNARLVSASKDHTVGIWDLATGEELTTVVSHVGVVQRVAFSEDGQRVIGLDDGKRLRLWRVDDGACVASVDALDSARLVTVATNGGRVAVGTTRGARVLSDQTLEPVGPMREGHLGEVAVVALSHDGTVLATSDGAAHALLWAV